jgi:nicotinamidase-related amidase
MDIRKSDTAVVFIDPQNDVLSEKGANWGAVGASVTENGTIENIDRIFKAAKANGYDVFISPHYFYPADSGWKFNGPLETDEFRTHSFARSGPLNLTGFSNSGADWLDRFKPFIEDGKTVVASPQGMGAADQRPSPAIAQTRDRQDHPRRHAGEHVRRIPPARAHRARVRSSGGQRRNRWTSASGMGRRLSSGDDQLPISRACSQHRTIDITSRMRKK